MPGRPAKPLALHLLHGTGRKSRLAKRKGEFRLPAGSIGMCPRWISPEAKQEWRRLLKTDWAKILTPPDRSVFLRYCILFGREMRAERGLKRWDNGREHPDAFEKIGSQEPNLLHQLSIQLGLTPAARAKIHYSPAEKPKSKWDEQA